MNEEQVLAQLLGRGDKIQVCHHHACGFPCQAEWDSEAVVTDHPSLTADKVTVPWRLCGGTSVGVSAYGLCEEVTRTHRASRDMAA